MKMLQARFGKRSGHSASTLISLVIVGLLHTVHGLRLQLS